MPSTLLTPMVRSGATYSPFSTLLSSPTSTVLACPSSRRTVVHHARPPRRPTQPTHLTHLTVKPTAGTSRPNPAAQPSLAPSVTLPDSGLEFHHAPPPSAPSYATGNVPDVIKWLSGADGVRIDAQSDAPFVKGAEKWLAKNRASLEGIQGLSEDVVRQMNALREAEPRKWSRSALMKKCVRDLLCDLSCLSILGQIFLSQVRHRSADI